jgi:3-oxoacyl-[acyl-carrier protein] reductase
MKATGDLSHKVVLVTGAARGIGAATARAAATAGASVLLLDLPNQPDAATLVGELGRDRCHLVVGDLARLDELPALWQKSLAWRGQIDVLINNAGIYEQAAVDGDFAVWHASWLRTLAVNLTAPAHLCREAIRHFQKLGGGIIVNVASRAAFRGDAPDYMNYAASKGGMVSLTRTIARGFASQNILAYAVAPGYVRTQLNAEFFRTNSEADAIRESPLGEMAMPEDIANIVIFLASGLARHATGATIDVNGASYVR